MPKGIGYDTNSVVRKGELKKKKAIKKRKTKQGAKVRTALRNIFKR